MTQNTPRVSICIPVYNRAHMVKPTIESALAQTYKDIEIIIVDDASTDNIEDIVASYSDPRLKFIKNPKNLGQFGNFNRCIVLARGEFLHILHSDDQIDPNFTETCVRFFDENPQVHLTFTSEVRRSSERTERRDFSDKNMVIPAPEGFKLLLRHGCIIPCPSVMTRRSVYERVGGYSLEFPIAADYYQWLKISRVVDIGFVKDACVFYHEGMHSESYRLFVSNPIGYVDRVKIVMQTITDLKDEYNQYLPEINHQLLILTLKFLMLSIIWNDAKKVFPPSFFTGLAHFSRSIIKPCTFSGHVKNFFTHVLILLINVFLYIPPIRYLIKYLITPFARKTIYLSGN